jgi:hypothetical protein
MKANYTCPVCRTGTQQDFMDVNVRMVLNFLARIPVKCTNCDKEMQRGDFNSHDCPVPCPNGCKDIILHRKLQEHDKVCKNVIVPCTAAELGCALVVLRSELEEHVQYCKYEQSRAIVDAIKQKHEEELEQVHRQYQKTIQDLERDLKILNDRLLLQQIDKNEQKTPKTIDPETGATPVDVKLKYVVAAYDDEVGIWDIETGTRIKALNGHKQNIYSAIQLVDGRIAFGGLAKVVCIWTPGSGSAQVIELEGHKDTVMCIVQQKNGTIASASIDKTLRVWDVETRKCLQTIVHNSSVYCVVQLKDSRLITGSKATIHLWGSTNVTFNGHTDVVRSIIQTKDDTIVSASNDKTVRMWDLQGTCLRVLTSHSTGVLSIVELSSGRFATSSKRMIHIWDYRDGEKHIRSLPRHNSDINAIIELNEGELVSGSDREIRVWNVERGERIAHTQCTGNVRSLAPAKYFSV